MPSTGFAHESPRGGSVEWFTPPEVFDALGLSFDLDPCSPGRGKSFVPAERVYTRSDDGLACPWGRSRVWLNPPYGRETSRWMRRMRDHAADGGSGIALVFARTDVAWFQEVQPSVDLVCFVSGRIRFFRGNTTDRGSTPGSGSMLLAWGPDCASAVLASGLGVCMIPVTPTDHDPSRRERRCTTSGPWSRSA